MKKEYDFSRARRARFKDLPPEEARARHTKIRITILLDQDVLQYFKARAAQPGAEPYQTQINRALRDSMAQGSPTGNEHLLTDERLITRLAERVAAYAAGAQVRAPRRRSRKTR
jgi:uncharacterized protein (DUF4415 family)